MALFRTDVGWTRIRFNASRFQSKTHRLVFGLKATNCEIKY
jgi:hypothetical protein